MNIGPKRKSKKKYLQKGKQTAEQMMCKKVRNLLKKHGSKPGQRQHQHFCRIETVDQLFFKIKNPTNQNIIPRGMLMGSLNLVIYDDPQNR